MVYDRSPLGTNDFLSGVMAKKSFLLVIFILFASIRSQAEESATVPSQFPAYDSQNLWIGPTVSLFVGFGVGVGLQGNYEKRGWIYGVADLASVFLVWKSITDCHSPQSNDSDCPMDDNRKLAHSIFIASRLAQIVDSSIWSYNYYGKYRSTAFILPKEDGISLNYAIEF